MAERAFVVEHIQAFLIFSALSFFFCALAASKGFFRLPKEPRVMPRLPFTSVLTAFGIYVGVFYFVAPRLKTPFAQFFSLLLVILFLFASGLSLKPPLFKKIWKSSSTSLIADLWVGAGTWLLGFPIVTAVGQLSDLALYVWLGVENYEQLAVQYLKTAQAFPLLLAAAIATIVLAAPLVEELLFRGFLQTWLRQRLGPLSAIATASLCFALFHLAPSQGAGNVSLALSLFVFSCFLGFVYERQGALCAPIALHATFNTINVLRILVYGDTV